MEATTNSHVDILDIIFAGKNKSYGAYDLRKTYNNRLVWALLLTAILISLFFLSYQLTNANKKKSPPIINIPDYILKHIEEPIKIFEDKKPAEQKKEQKKQIESVRITKTTIVKDNLVSKTDLPPDIDKILDSKIDNIATKGTKEEGIITQTTTIKGSIVGENKIEEDKTIFVSVEKEAEFPGGAAAWKRYLERYLNTQTAMDNGAPGGLYTVQIKFVVSKDGSISDIQCINDPGYGMGEEAIKVIRKGPLWKPAFQNGIHVNAFRTQSIVFRIVDQ